MIIIADSGSTKTDWAVIEENKLIDRFESIGMNPMTQTENHIDGLLHDIDKIQSFHSKVKRVHFYGAGCSNESKKLMMKNILLNRFNNSEINIQHDLYGAALALCGNKEGIVCILGTGSNCCYFDGEQIHDRRFGNGYIYGDEGSGFDMGKRLIRQYLAHSLPNDLKITFEKKFSLDRDSLLNQTYSHSHPNSYVAQFTTFLSENLDHDLIRSIISNSFESFVVSNIQKLDVPISTRVNCVGSIGWVFQDILKEVGVKHSLAIGEILKKPMDGLIKYHIKN
jgi:N-acetylglucosamine kinase-like BadF-type ATPase